MCQKSGSCRAGSPTQSFLILQCLSFFCPCFCLSSLSFIRPKPSRLFLHASLLPPNTVTKGCVLSFPLGSFVPTNQQLLFRLRCPPTLSAAGTQKVPPPPGCHLSSLLNWPLLGRLVFSSLLFSNFPVTNQCQKSFFQLFLSL